MGSSPFLRRSAAIALILTIAPAFGACAQQGAHDGSLHSNPAIPEPDETLDTESAPLGIFSTLPEAGISPELERCFSDSQREETQGHLLYEQARVKDGPDVIVSILSFALTPDGEPDLSTGPEGEMKSVGLLLRLGEGGCQSVYPETPNYAFEVRDHLSRSALYALRAEEMNWFINASGGMEAFVQRLRLTESKSSLIECPSDSREGAGSGPGDEFYPCVDAPEAAAYRGLGVEVQEWSD